MPEGTFRRPPQLWEQKIANMVAVNSVGSVSGGGTEEVGADLPPGNGGPAPEPPVIAPTPTAFDTPSTPTLAGTVQGIRVTWDGLNSSGDPYPPDAYVEIHIATSGGTFTPSSTTFRGTLTTAGTFTVFGLTAGTTYYIRLLGKDGQGNVSTASTAASGTTGLTSSGDYGTATIDAGAVSFDARAIGGITTTVGTTAPTSPVTGDIWLDSTGGVITHKRWSGSAWVTQAWGSNSLSANCITATQIAAGAVTAGAIAAGSITTAKLDASAVTADKIAAGAITATKISAGAIDGQTITGATIRTASTGARVAMNDGGRAAYLDIYSGNGSLHSLYGNLGDLVIAPSSRLVIGTNTQIQGNLSFVTGGAITATSLDTSGNTTVNGTFDANAGVTLGTSSGSPAVRIDASGNVYSLGLSNATAGGTANVVCATGASSQLRLAASTVRIKTDVRPLADGIVGVPDDKMGAPSDLDARAVLDIVPAEFESIAADAGSRYLGFIAEDVAAKLPMAAEYDADGQPRNVDTRAILAALLAVVQQQQQTITDLTARVEALEAK